MDIKDLLPLMQQYKVKRAKLGALEVELDASAFAAPAEARASAPKVPAFPAMPEDFTFYSVPDQSPLIQFDRADISKPAPAAEVLS